jgi:hypothetical protein
MNAKLKRAEVYEPDNVTVLDVTIGTNADGVVLVDRLPRKHVKAVRWTREMILAEGDN